LIAGGYPQRFLRPSDMLLPGTVRDRMHIQLRRRAFIPLLGGEYAMVLTAAHEQVSRNDFLLTAAILTHIHRKTSR
jgi:hypothetical protein